MISTPKFIVITVVVLFASITYHGRTTRHDELESALSSAIVESFEYGYTCRAADRPHDECLAVVKEIFNN